MPAFLKIIIVALFAGALFGMSGQANAARCFGPKPILGFSPTVSKTKYNISESAFDLHKLHGGGGAGLVTGLALSPLYYEFEALYNVRETDQGYCVALDKIKVFYRARPIVFISNEFPRGSCEFKAVLYHENKHVKTLKKVHSKSASDFKDHVTNSLDRIRPLGPVSKSQVKSAQQKMQKDLEFFLDEFLVEINHKLRKEQNKVDSPSEYARVDNECDDWIGRLRLE